MKLFKVTAQINGLLTEELVEAAYPQEAINIFKKRHSADNIKDLNYQIYTIWGWT